MRSMKNLKKLLAEYAKGFVGMIGVRLEKVKATEYSREFGIRVVESYKQWVLVIGTGKSGIRIVRDK
jgi:hypothetical protein